MRVRLMLMLVLGCGGTSTSAEPIEITHPPARRLSDSPVRSSCAMGRLPMEEGPSVNADVVANVVERTADEARATIAQHTGAPSNPDALFALASAQMDLYRLEGDRLVLQDAIRTWATLVQNAPSYPEMDQVLYQLAWGLTSVDQHDRARQVYHRLIRAYPRSPLIIMAYVQFGDYYARQGDAIVARRFYERAREMPEEDVLMSAYIAYAYAWASHAAGESVDPETLEHARAGANQALLEAIETDWCQR